jgi:hypothetical protein
MFWRDAGAEVQRGGLDAGGLGNQKRYISATTASDDAGQAINAKETQLAQCSRQRVNRADQRAAVPASRAAYQNQPIGLAELRLE